MKCLSLCTLAIAVLTVGCGRPAAPEPVTRYESSPAIGPAPAEQVVPEQTAEIHLVSAEKLTAKTPEAEGPETLAAETPAENTSRKPDEPAAAEDPGPEFSVVGPGSAVRLSFDDFDLMKLLDIDPVPADVSLPAWLSRMDGRRVRLRGFMYPTYTDTGLTGFVLARDNEICCFGRNPKIYDLVPVELGPGNTTDYIRGRPFDVVGTFHVEPEADGDELWQLYYMTDAAVLD